MPRLTYAELDRRANQLALAIASATRIETDTTIAVFVERTTDLPVALLAVLKSGAAYVPIDPSLPLERAKQIISDANCSAIVASHSTARRLARLYRTFPLWKWAGIRLCQRFSNPPGYIPPT